MATLRVPGQPPGGWLILIGGGEFSFGETQEIDELLVGLLPADRRTIAFIPAASGSSEYGRHLGDHFRRIDESIEVTTVPIYRERDARRGRNLEAIRGAGAVYIGAGVTNSLLDALRDTPALEALREYLGSGGIVVAIGAAAAACGSFCRDMRRLPGVTPGLSLVDRACVEPLFEPGRDQFVRTLMAIPEVDLVWGIPAGTALVIQPAGEAEIAGAGTVAAIRRPPPQDEVADPLPG